MTLEERFWSNVKKGADEECWEWQGYRVADGYGNMRVNGKPTGAHRIAWGILCGPIPKGLLVLHHCDNPPCVNPSHLHLGTFSDNLREAYQRNRIPSRRGENAGNAKITWEDANRIRALFAEGAISKAELGRQFGVSRRSILFIVRYEHWVPAEAYGEKWREGLEANP